MTCSMLRALRAGFSILLLGSCALAQAPAAASTSNSTVAIPDGLSGFRDAAVEQKLEEKFLAVPDVKLAREHLRTLTAEPHIAGSVEDKKTADYVAGKFREAGLDVRIDEYKVWLNLPKEILVEATAPEGLKMKGPTREHAEGDPYQDDSRVVMPFNGSSPSGDVEADLVYANYARPEDFKRLRDMGVEVKGKIVIARYGQNFRGVKALTAQEAGAIGLIIYSDPADDGYFRGDAYPKGPYRPPTGVQRGSVQFTFEYAGDATTPGVASTLDLPASARIAPEKAASLPKIPVTPLSYADASPLLERLGGPESPREWQGALPFTYHVGPGPTRVHVKLVQDYKLRTIWNVIGTIRGSQQPEALVIAGNHRDAWVYGAVDPSSGTAAMLESVHAMGALLKTGWRPKRTIIFASWDAEEYGLIGSTEYAEQYAKQLQGAIAYLNMDVGVSGPNFGASGVPSLKGFLRDVARAVPSPKGGSVYDVWKAQGENNRRRPTTSADTGVFNERRGEADSGEAKVGDLGSGSDYSAFLQHLGVPSTDIGSGGPYGVYHSVFDNYAWFTRNADPEFVYEQEMARVFGLEALRLAQADLLPFDYETYGTEVTHHLEAIERRARQLGWVTGAKDEKAAAGGAASSAAGGVADNAAPQLDFAAALKASARLAEAGKACHKLTATSSAAQVERLNQAYRGAERALLGSGLPHRTWFRHTIYAPGEYTGYAAVVLPGVTESMDKDDKAAAVAGLAEATAALQRAATLLESAL